MPRIAQLSAYADADIKRETLVCLHPWSATRFPLPQPHPIDSTILQIADGLSGTAAESVWPDENTLRTFLSRGRFSII